MFNGRVNGDLAVARAFGDFAYKQRDDLPPEAQEVSCEPEIRIRARKETDRVLVMACDGVWDVWSDLDAFRTELCDRIVGEEGVDEPEERGKAGGRAEFLPGPVSGARQHRQHEHFGVAIELSLFLMNSMYRNKQSKRARPLTSSAASGSSFPSLQPQPWSSYSS